MARNKDTLDFIVEHWQELSMDLNNLLDALDELQNTANLRKNEALVHDVINSNSDLMSKMSTLIDNPKFTAVHKLDNLYAQVDLFQQCALELLTVIDDPAETQFMQIYICMKQQENVQEEFKVVTANPKLKFKKQLDRMQSQATNISQQVEELNKLRYNEDNVKRIKDISIDISKKSEAFNEKIVYNPLSYSAHNFLDPIKLALDVLITEMNTPEPNYDEVLDYSIELSHYLHQAIAWYHTAWWQNIGGKAVRSAKAREFERLNYHKKRP